MHQVKNFLDKYHTLLFIALIIISFYIKFVYIFYFTEYMQYLQSDMVGYWNRALSSFNGDDTDSSQWYIWPPFSHITLAWFFKVLYVLDLSEQKLQAVMIMNVILSTISVIFVYLIARKLDISKIYALIVVFIYAFFFPLIYLNAFVLSEHLSLFMLLLSITLLFYANINNTSTLLLIGIVLAFSTAMRPSFGVLGLPFFIFILFSNKDNIWKSIGNAFIFSIGFFSFILFISIENYHNSSGKIKTLSSNGGLNFYFSQCDAHQVIYEANGDYVWILPPSSTGKPELGTLKTDVHLYNQNYFYDKGLTCLKQNPDIWMKNLKKFRYLYFDSMLPYYYSAQYATDLLPFFSMVALFLTLTLLFAPLLFFDKHISRAKVLFLFSIVVAQLFVLYFFNVEQRYLYGFFFVIVLFSPLVFLSIKRNFKKIQWWFLLLVLVYTSIIGYYWWQKEPINKVIKMTISQDKRNLYSIRQKRRTINSFTDTINTINFKTANKLIHDDLGRYPFKKNIFIDFFVTLTVLEKKEITFIVASDDGFIFYLNDKIKMSYARGRSVDITEKTLFLTPKEYSLKVSYYQGMGSMAIRVYYEIDGRRYLVGEDSQYVQFK